LTQGQPWLVNALGYETCFKMQQGRERTRPITSEMIYEAKENLILRRETHLDQLADKLKEERVRRVVAPILQGTELGGRASDNDLQYVIDLGLVRRTAAGPQIANAIYREIVPRELTTIIQADFESLIEPVWYVRADGRLDLAKLLTAFQQFFREHSESWVERFDYREAGPQLLLQAFLQRVVNRGGRVEREYGLGRKRTDLLVIWPVGGSESANQRMSEWLAANGNRPSAIGRPPSAISYQRAVIELKVLHKSLDATLAEGLAQTWEYADRCRADEAHLVIFDRTPGKAWEEKVWRRVESHQGMGITVWGM
jgi:hypothetical protein